MGGEEVHRTLAPPGALHDEHTGTVVDELDDRERTEVRTWEALADGMIDAAILARLEAGWAGRTAEQRSQAWIDRQLAKTHASVKAMSQGLGEKPFCAGIYLSLADIAVGCALGYLDFRFNEIDWRTSYPNLTKLHEKLMQRASFSESLPK